MLTRLLADLFGRRARKAERLAAAAPPDPFAAVSSAIEARELDRAARALREAGAAHPEDARSDFLLAEIRRLAGDHASAVTAYRRALLREPRMTAAWIGLGDCHARTGEPRQAFLYYRTALALEPDRVDALNEIGLVAFSLGNHNSAAESFERAVSLVPGHAEAWNNLGIVFASRGGIEEARHCFHRATHLKPAFYTALCNLGLACRELGRLDESAQALRQAAEADPRKPTAWENLAATLQDCGELDEAADALARALEADPASPGALIARGLLSTRLGKVDEARSAFESALTAAPGDAEASLGLAHLDLSCGRYASGWDLYEARLRKAQSPRRRFPHAEWDGARPVEKLLVYAEQGLGDTILFASCLPDLLARVPRCFFDCEDRLWPVMARSFPGVERYGRETPAVDAYVAIGSLPRLYRRSIDAFPSRASFLLPDPVRVGRARAAMASLGGALKVGLAWRGGLQSTGRQMRSLGLAELRSLLACPGVAWVSLQRGDAAAEIEAFSRDAGVRVHELGEVGEDLDNAAAIACAADLVITVCSSVVHLSGALGRPTWVLTPRVPAWRYRLDGEDMPWYPTVRLFRQQTAGNWAPVIERLRAALAALVRGEGA